MQHAHHTRRFDTEGSKWFLEARRVKAEIEGGTVDPALGESKEHVQAQRKQRKLRRQVGGAGQG